MYRILSILTICWAVFSHAAQAQINDYDNASAPFQVQITPPGSPTPISIWVVNVNGQIIADGDMIIGRAEDFGRGAGIQVVALGFWPSNTIPYEIKPGHPDSASIMTAISNMNSQTCFNIRKRNGEANYIYFTNDIANKCSSPVGFGTGRRTINVSGCGVGSVMHEICHSIGLIHEQSRPDRDTYIRLDTSNIKPEKRHNFQKWGTAVASSSNYDFASIMHYPASISNSAWVISGSTATVFRSRGTNAAADEALMGSGSRNARLSATDLIALRAICAVSGMPGLSGSNPGNSSSDVSSAPENDVPQGSGTTTIDYTFPGSSTPKRITVSVVNGMAVLDGDMVLGPIDQLGRGGATIAANSGGTNRRWDSCTMPYDLNSHPCSDTIRKAIQALDAATNLTLVPRNKETDYIKFVTGSGYSSPVGKQGGAQNITISASGGCPVSGKVIHEMLHSAGLFHEQSRGDRGSSIKIDTANLKPGMRHNFQTYLERGLTGSDTGPYDFGSIMHYPSKISDPSMVFDMSKPVITSIPPGSESLMGQRRRLSAGDISTVNTIYTCGSSSSSGSAASTSGDINVEWSVDLAPAGANYSAFDAAGAMLIAWLPPAATIDPQEIVNRTGFWGQFNYNLDPKLPISFVNWGLERNDPRTYTPRELFGLVRSGPVLATGGNRVRVIYGMRGDGSPTGTTVLFADPLDRDKQAFRAPNAGFTGQATFQEFINALGGGAITIGHF